MEFVKTIFMTETTFSTSLVLQLHRQMKQSSETNFLLLSTKLIRSSYHRSLTFCCNIRPSDSAAGPLMLFPCQQNNTGL